MSAVMIFFTVWLSSGFLAYVIGSIIQYYYTNKLTVKDLLMIFPCLLAGTIMLGVMIYIIAEESLDTVVFTRKPRE